MKTVFELLNPDNTLSVNRRLAHALGLAEAVIYAALLAKHEWYAKQDMLTDGWFYSTIEDLEESTALSGKVQRRCIKELTELGLIKTRQVGIPSRRYFYILENAEFLRELCSGGEPEARALREAEARPERTEAPAGNVQESPEVAAGSSRKSCKTKVNKTKENKQELSNSVVEPSALEQARSQIDHQLISQKYGEGFADLAAEVTAEGISGAFAVESPTDGRTVTKKDVSSVFRMVDNAVVCHVADYVSGRNDIRNLKAYLRTALYKTAQELPQRPSGQPQSARESSRPASDDIDAIILEELLREYNPNYAV